MAVVAALGSVVLVPSPHLIVQLAGAWSPMVVVGANEMVYGSPTSAVGPAVRIGAVAAALMTSVA